MAVRAGESHPLLLSTSTHAWINLMACTDKEQTMQQVAEASWVNAGSVTMVRTYWALEKETYPDKGTDHTVYQTPYRTKPLSEGKIGKFEAIHQNFTHPNVHFKRMRRFTPHTMIQTDGCGLLNRVHKGLIGQRL